MMPQLPISTENMVQKCTKSHVEIGNEAPAGGDSDDCLDISDADGRIATEGPR